MYEGKEKRKKYRMARLHEMVLNARDRGLPWKLAELGALCVAIGAGIWAAQHGRMIIGSAIVMFILYSIILQIGTRLAFLAISLITLPAYKIYEKHTQGSNWFNEWDPDDFGWRSTNKTYQKKNYYEYYSDSEQNCKSGQGWQYEQSEESKREEDSATGNKDDEVKDQARALFGLDEAFTIEELKAARNEALKKWHPDQNISGDQAEAYEEMTKKINEAYRILEGYA